MMTAVLMRLPDPDYPDRIGDTDGVLEKAGFNPDKPRDERGRWTSGGGNGERQTSESDDTPNIILAAAEGEDDRGPRFGIGGNHPPPEELIPQRLQQSPAGPVVQFFDNLLGISEPGDEANLEVAQLQMRDLLD
jgi:hypothetical protein